MIAGPTVGEVVRSAGGWLFDQVAAGWDVTVIVSEHGDTRPLQILGASAIDLDSSMDASVRSPMPHALAVSAALYESDARVRQGVLNALDNGAMDVSLWGDTWPTDLEGRFTTAAHTLSVAARAFKGYALAAAGAPTDVIGNTESFHNGTPSLALSGS